MTMTQRDILDTELAFAKLHLNNVTSHRLEIERNKKAARRHIYKAWKLCNNIARIARELGLSRPYVSEMIKQGRKEQ